MHGAGHCGSNQLFIDHLAVERWTLDHPCMPTCIAAEAITTPEVATLQCCSDSSSAASGSSQCQPLLLQLQPEEAIQSRTSTSGLPELLLSAAGKLQQLVELLTVREPSAAAELSVLQWQLISGYGQLPGSRCSTGGDAAATNAPISSQQHHGVCSSNATNSHPLLAATTAGPEQGMSANSHQLRAAGAGPVAGQTCLQDCFNVAAAARLFSGATTQLQAPHLSWYYLDGSRVRGPHDPALMIRWYCNCFIEQQLPVAAVLQQPLDSSSPPPLTAFVPLKELLARVEQGCSYQPHMALEQTQQQMQQQLGPQLPGSTSNFCQVQPVTMGLQQIAARLRDVAMLEPRSVKDRNSKAAPSAPVAAGQLTPVKQHQSAGAAAATGLLSNSNAIQPPPAAAAAAAAAAILDLTKYLWQGCLWPC